ncbi:MAG TPA: HAMP domain-containing sensor histidine kinase [Patescibacteria group bacterium]|nr:HAMP domain-containing sensor histidine kinase [Patescibacteria group bacterium]
MNFKDVVRTATFRQTIYFAAALSISTLLLFAFIFWQTSIVETKRVDHSLVRDAEVIALETPQEARHSVERRIAADFHRIVYAALFDAEGQWVAGNLKQFPPGLLADGQAHRMRLGMAEDSGKIGRIVGRRLADGRILIIGRDVESLEDLEGVVLRALELGVIPAILLALVGGVIVSLRTQRHIQAVHETAERIAGGELWQRLPTRDSDDNFDRLAANVNQMLDGVGHLLDDMKSTSDNIAHDLRSPLARVRTHLDRALESSLGNEELRDMVDRAIAGLDQALRIISALRRIAHIEARERRAGFADVDLEAVVKEVGEFYQPLAEEARISFVMATTPVPALYGDRDLLVEAIANLVDNALKYTPAGGRVRLSLDDMRGWPTVRVEDDGPGIPPEEREAVMRRFYRSARTRHIQGSGLGLSLVDAIVKLHGFDIKIGEAGGGCVFEMSCPSPSSATRR